MDLVDDIVVILHLRKIDKLKINFDVQTDTMIAGMIEKLSSIKPEKWRQKARKEQLGSFFHNLQHINEITNFNYTAMLNMKCVVSKSKINGSETAEFQSKNIGLENVGATCYMNATMQMYVHAQVLYEFFYYYEGGKDGNRFFSMIEFWKNHNPRFGADVFGKKEIDENKNYITNWDSFNQSNKDHVKRFRKLCIKRLEHFETYKNRWAELSNNGIEELQLILQCFYDDEFYQTLLNKFGKPVMGHTVVADLPDKAINIGREFFLLLKGIINRENDPDPNGKQYFSPRRFKDFLGIINPLFQGIAANDSKDLIICLIENWHDLYNTGKTKSLPLGGNVSQAVITSIQEQVSVIIGCLNLLDSMYRDQASDYIKNCIIAIKRDLQNSSAALGVNALKYLSDAIDQIQMDIMNRKEGDNNSLLCIENKLQQFNNALSLNLAPPSSNAVLKAFSDKYFSENVSIFVDEFYFVIENTIKCKNCNCAKTSFNVANILIFPLGKIYQCKLREETQTLQTNIEGLLSQLGQVSNATQVHVYIHKLQQKISQYQKDIVSYMGNSGDNVEKSKDEMNKLQKEVSKYLGTMLPQQRQVYQDQEKVLAILNRKGTITFKECFDHYKLPEPLSGQNQIYCNTCHGMADGFTSNTMVNMPKSMTMIINRGKGIEFPVDLEPEDAIDPWDILDVTKSTVQCFCWMEINANIVHYGESSMSGHFISIIKSRKDNQPRIYNDSVPVGERKDVMDAKQTAYVVRAEKMTLHREINVILTKVTNKEFKAAICAKFFSLGVLDKKEKQECNRKRQEVFAYLLTYAYKKCAAYKNIVVNQGGLVNQYKCQNFDNYLSDFICAAFNLIALTDHFDFTDNGRNQTFSDICKWRNTILQNAQNPNYDPSEYIIDGITKDFKIAEFNIYNDDNANVKEGNNINNINNVNMNRNYQSGNINNASDIPRFNCTLKFKFNGNTFEKTIHDVDKNATTVKQVFDDIVADNTSVFGGYKNFKIMPLSGQDITTTDQISESKVVNLGPYMVNNTLTFDVSGEKVQRHNDCILGKLGTLTDKIKREKFVYLLGICTTRFEYLTAEDKSNLVCATFELIKMETKFSEEFMEKCNIIVEVMGNQISNIRQALGQVCACIQDHIDQINNQGCLNKICENTTKLEVGKAGEIERIQECINGFVGIDPETSMDVIKEYINTNVKISVDDIIYAINNTTTSPIKVASMIPMLLKVQNINQKVKNQ